MQSYQENRDFCNWLNRKLPATQISVRMTAIAERREIKRAFISKALCTHELTFSVLWREVGKCCCFRWGNWGRRLVRPVLRHSCGWVVTHRLCSAWQHLHLLPHSSSFLLSEVLLVWNFPCCYVIAGKHQVACWLSQVALAGLGCSFCFSCMPPPNPQVLLSFFSPCFVPK